VEELQHQINLLQIQISQANLENGRISLENERMMLENAKLKAAKHPSSEDKYLSKRSLGKLGKNHLVVSGKEEPAQGGLQSTRSAFPSPALLALHSPPSSNQIKIEILEPEREEKERERKLRKEHRSCSCSDKGTQTSFPAQFEVVPALSPTNVIKWETFCLP